jgi:hypothetical protein
MGARYENRLFSFKMKYGWLSLTFVLSSQFLLKAVFFRFVAIFNDDRFLNLLFYDNS